MPALPKGVTKEKLTVNGSKRTYFLYLPGQLNQATPAPVILLLHGSGRDGWSLVKKWIKLAEKENIILVGPNAADPEVWKTHPDGPEFFRTVIEHAGRKAPIDHRRIYMFGHSGGCLLGLVYCHLRVAVLRGRRSSRRHAGALHLPLYGEVESTDTHFAASRYPGQILSPGGCTGHPGRL